MDRYLMMLYVTLDQETALKHFFIEHGWAFSKPDLSITTDNVGPSIVPASNVEDTTERMAEFMSPAESLVALNQSVCSNLGRKRKKLTVARNSLLAKHPKSDLSELQSEETQCIDSSHSDVLTQSRSVNLTFPVTVRCENEQQVVIKLERADDELELTHQTHQNSGIDVTNNILDEIEGNSDNDNSENTSHDFYSNVDQPSADSGVETVIDTKEDILEPDMKRSADAIDNVEQQVDGLLAMCKRSSNDYKCCVCEKSIRMKYNMKRHLRLHLPNKTNCVICNQFFGNEEQKAEHMRVKHSSRHICDICGVSFKRKSDMNRHLLRHEKLDGTSPLPNFFKCGFKDCGKIFFCQTSFGYHWNMHVNEKPFVCSRCSKSFHSEYSKNAHEKTCLNNVKFICEKCNKEFKQRSGLYNHVQAEHVKKNEGFCCELCSQKFKYLTGLIKHTKEKHKSIDATQQTDTAVYHETSNDGTMENKTNSDSDKTEETNDVLNRNASDDNFIEELDGCRTAKEPDENLIATKLNVDRTLISQIIAPGTSNDHVIVLRPIPASTFFDNMTQNQEKH